MAAEGFHDCRAASWDLGELFNRLADSLLIWMHSLLTAFFFGELFRWIIKFSLILTREKWSAQSMSSDKPHLLASDVILKENPLFCLPGMRLNFFVTSRIITITMVNRQTDKVGTGRQVVVTMSTGSANKAATMAPTATNGKRLQTCKVSGLPWNLPLPEFTQRKTITKKEINKICKSQRRS